MECRKLGFRDSSLLHVLAERGMRMAQVSDMHKREWLAGQAMTAFLAHPTRLVQEPNETDEQFFHRVALCAFGMADAMIQVGYRKDSRH